MVPSENIHTLRSRSLNSLKVLITGGAGFIGSHVADRLLATGNQVLVVDNQNTGKDTNNQPSPGLRSINASVADEVIIRKAFEEFQPDVVIHAAASYKNPDDWTQDVTTNIIGTITIARLSKEYQVKKLVYLQTSLCYGLHVMESPIRIDYPVSGEGSSYSISKTAAERYLDASGLDYLSFRLANVYGPRNLTGPLPKFYASLINNEPCVVVKSRRDFIYVGDVADLIVKSLDSTQRGAYHVSTGKDISIEELFIRMKQAIGIVDHPVSYKDIQSDDVASLLLDPSKTNADFDWYAETDLNTGICCTIEWYRQNSVTTTYTHLKAFK